jgi:cytochrome c biogenesis protein CcmG, thiol:disulfide interchange protein DsbE
MKRVALLSLLCCGLQAQQAADALKMVRDAYTNLSTVHIVATRTDSVMMPNSMGGQATTEYELAEAPGGKYLARMKNGENESLAVSDGSTTWKALPKQKRWAKLEAAAVSGDEDASDDDAKADTAGKPSDLHDAAENLLIRRYLAIARVAKAAEIGKEENIKVGGEKFRCRIVRLQVGPAVDELWVDEQRGFVLQARQTSRQEMGNGQAQIQITTKLKELDLGSDVDARLFSFTPERSWTEAEMLVLPGEERMMLTGQKAAEFALKSLDGEPVALSSLRGKVVVLDFWATWCGPCRHELPIVDKLREEFADKVQFLGINDEDNGTVKSFLRKNAYGITVLMDSKRTVHRTYGVHAIPTLFVIDREGVIRQHFIGGREAPELRKAIAQVLGVSSEPVEARR